jgi:hypothetical protein
MVERGIISESDSLFLTDEEQLKHEAMKRRQTIISSQVEEQLRHRIPLEYLANKGIFLDTTPTERGVERAFLVHTLANALSNRPDHGELADKGFMLDGGIALQKAFGKNKTTDSPQGMKSEIAHEEIVHRRQSLEQGLNSRSSIDTLKCQGIYMDESSRRAYELERSLLKDSLSHRLKDPHRPSAQDLEASGVLLSTISGACSPREMAHMVAARQIKHGLEHRMSLNDLKSRGFYVDSPNMQEGYDILMKHSILDKNLSHVQEDSVVDSSSMKYILILNSILDVHASFKVPIAILAKHVNQ